MRIGVIGDSHDNLPAIMKSVELFDDKDTDLVIHTGDLISPFVKKPFSNLKCEMKCILGNNDGEIGGLKENLDIEGDYLEEEIVFNGKELHLFALHGENESIVNSLALSGNYDLILRGHTHQPMIDMKNNGSIVLNPGESSGYLSGTKTVALIDLKGDWIKIFDIDSKEIVLEETIEEML